MKRLIKLGLLCLTSITLTSCGSKTDNDNSGNTKTTDTTDKFSSDGLNELKNKYGELKISREDGKETNYTYNESKNEYRIAIEDIKAKYVISGYTTAHFVVTNTNNLTAHKGMKIKLNNACIISDNDDSPIYYAIENKNIEISAKNETSNIIATLKGANAIESDNNIELGGNGTLELYTKSLTSSGTKGHTIKSSNKVSIYDSIKLDITSAHDGINADEVITLNEDDNTNYTGTINFKNIGSQAIEGTTKKCGGYINLTSGTYNIDSAESVFKTDTELNILKDAKVIAINIKGEPIVKQTKEELEDNITIPVLNVNVEGTFTSNGNNITSGKK